MQGPAATPTPGRTLFRFPYFDAAVESRGQGARCASPIRCSPRRAAACSSHSLRSPGPQHTIYTPSTHHGAQDRSGAGREHRRGGQVQVRAAAAVRRAQGRQRRQAGGARRAVGAFPR